MTEQTGNNKPNEAERLGFTLSGNEKLIEEAYRQGRSDERYSLAYAPPVFEKTLGEATLTPTDDEREALARAWDAGHRKGIRWKRGDAPENPYRSEVPEPTGDEREALGIMILRVADEEKPVWEAGLDAIVDAVAGFRSGEVLVEGSWFKRDDLPTVLGNFMRSSNEYARQAKELHVALTELRSLEPQGEPSEGVIRNHGGWDMGLQSKSYPPDSAVDAALTAWNVTGGSDRVAMRAALRAAGVVGQEGEQR